VAGGLKIFFWTEQTKVGSIQVIGGAVMTEILFSREAEEFFEELLISDFSDREVNRLKQIEDAKSIVDAEIKELSSAIEKDDKIKSIDRVRMVDQLKTILRSKDYTLLRSTPFKTYILDKYFISSIPIYSYIQLITAMQLGFAIGINRGISSGLSRKRTWHAMVKDVWKKCVRDMHPFQKGDTNQGTKHCISTQITAIWRCKTSGKSLFAR
jgi:hypothetical protein